VYLPRRRFLAFSFPPFLSSLCSFGCYLSTPSLCLILSRVYPIVLERGFSSAVVIRSTFLPSTLPARARARAYSFFDPLMTARDSLLPPASSPRSRFDFPRFFVDFLLAAGPFTPFLAASWRAIWRALDVVQAFRVLQDPGHWRSIRAQTSPWIAAKRRDRFTHPRVSDEPVRVLDSRLPKNGSWQPSRPPRCVTRTAQLKARSDRIAELLPLRDRELPDDALLILAVWRRPR